MSDKVCEPSEDRFCHGLDIGLPRPFAMLKNKVEFTLAYRGLPLYTYYSGYSRQGVNGNEKV